MPIEIDYLRSAGIVVLGTFAVIIPTTLIIRALYRRHKKRSVAR